HVSDDPEVAMVGDPVKLLAGLHALTVNDLLLDHIAGCRRGPIEGAWTTPFSRTSRMRLSGTARLRSRCSAPSMFRLASAAAPPLPRWPVPMAMRRSICARWISAL